MFNRSFAIAHLTFATSALGGLVTAAPALAQTNPLNDTGINFCGAASSGNNAACLVTDPAGQDRHYRRDAAARAGTLPIKVGGSAGAVGGTANGFDFTKIANNGSALSATAALGTTGSDWACTRDNLTGLIWEVKTTSGLRNRIHTYTWFKTNNPTGDNGIANGGTCAVAGSCDTEKYTASVNVVALCGFADWRMPTIKELEGIADFGRSQPAIDPVYFPNTPNSEFWSGSNVPDAPAASWNVDFAFGNAQVFSPSFAKAVRLVRSAP